MGRTPISKLEAGRRAKNVAIKALIELHQDEFGELYAKARVDAGLPPEPASKPRSKQEILREQLRAAGLEPVV